MTLDLSTSLTALSIRPLYRLLADQPQALESLSAEYGLPSQEQLKDETVRISIVGLYRILDWIVDALDRPAIALDLTQAQGVGGLGSLSYLLLSCDSLAEALTELKTYFEYASFASEPPNWEVTGNKEFFIELYPQQAPKTKRYYARDLLAAGMVSMIRQTCDVDYKPIRVELPGEPPPDVQSYNDFFQCPLVFNAEKLRIFSAGHWLEKPFANSNLKLKKVFRQELDSIISQLRTDSSIIDRIRQLLVGLESLRPVSQSWLATQLHTSERTLSRQLAEVGLSFRDMLTNFRNAKSIEFLSEGLAIDQIADYLGFSERAAFDRAFKKWQGVTPSKFQSQYRRLSAETNIADLISLEKMPNLPATASQLLQLVQNDNFHMDELAIVVERDPVLAAKLISLSNSAFYGMFNNKSIKDAVVNVFGVDRLRNLAMTLLASSNFQVDRCEGFSLKTFWISALGTAQLAADISRAAGEGTEIQSEVYLVGLLHNIGQLLLVHCFPEKMGGALLDIKPSAGMQEICAIQKLRIGVDANEAGALLASKWQLPRSISVVIRQISTGKYDGDFANRAMLIGGVEAFVRNMSQDSDANFDALSDLAEALDIDEAKLIRCKDKFKDNYKDLESIAQSLV